MKTEPNQLAHSFNHTANTEGNFNGLTKREYFAAMAMQGFIANHLTVGNSAVEISEMAVLHADCLITQLNES